MSISLSPVTTSLKSIAVRTYRNIKILHQLAKNVGEYRQQDERLEKVVIPEAVGINGDGDIVELPYLDETFDREVAVEGLSGVLFWGNIGFHPNNSIEVGNVHAPMGLTVQMSFDFEQLVNLYNQEVN